MPNSVNNTCLEASICRLQNTKIDSDSDFSRRCPDASWCCPNGELCNRLSKKCWFSFLNNVTSGRCCLSVRTVALQLHTIFIIRTRVLTVLPWRPDGCNSSPRLALSRIASERLQLSSHIYLCEWNLFTYRTLTGIRTVLPFESSKHWWASGRMTLLSGWKLGIWFLLTWKLHRFFFELWKAHFWNKDFKINGIP